MTTPDLKAAALAATPGPWECDSIKNDGEYGIGEDCHAGFTSYSVCKDGQVICDTLNSGLIEVEEEFDEDSHTAWDCVGKRNAAFIAAANPATILALLERLQVAEDAVKDGERLDFILRNSAFTVATLRDSTFKQYQCWDQDGDENYHVLSGDEKFFNTEREAIDAAITARRSA